MKSIGNSAIFGLAVLLGIAGVLADLGYSHWQRPPKVDAHRLTSQIWVAEQLNLAAIPQLKERGFKTIIDLRPDGEAADQPPAAAVESAARAQQLHFAYVPVPHGDIP